MLLFSGSAGHRPPAAAACRTFCWVTQIEQLPVYLDARHIHRNQHLVAAGRKQVVMGSTGFLFLKLANGWPNQKQPEVRRLAVRV